VTGERAERDREGRRRRRGKGGSDWEGKGPSYNETIQTR